MAVLRQHRCDVGWQHRLECWQRDRAEHACAANDTIQYVAAVRPGVDVENCKVDYRARRRKSCQTCWSAGCGCRGECAVGFEGDFDLCFEFYCLMRAKLLSKPPSTL